MADNTERPEDSTQPKTDAAALADQAEAAEADAAEATALAVAARARARAVRLRQQAQSAAEAPETDDLPVDDETDTPPADDETDTPPAHDDETDDLPVDDDETDALPADDETPRRARPATALAAAAVVAVSALLGAGGYIALQHHGAVQHRQRAAAFTAAAKQGVVNMMSLDFHHAEEDVQRMLDSSTGEFRDDFERQAADFVTVAKKSQVISEGMVDLAAVESMEKQSAVVLVSATSRVTNSAGAKEEPRGWRLRVTVIEDGDQVKMSKLVYVP